jgi:hypothetical protein
MVIKDFFTSYFFKENLRERMTKIASYFILGYPDVDSVA